VEGVLEFVDFEVTSLYVSFALPSHSPPFASDRLVIIITTTTKNEKALITKIEQEEI
jgi:hypothetical protein